MPYDDQYDPYSQYTRIMRMQNLFSPQPVSSWAQPNSVMPDYTPQPIQDMYQPRTHFTDLYTDAINNYPERGEPSTLNKIGGIMAGLGAGVRPVGISGGQPIGFQGDPMAAMATFDQVANQDYYKGIADYTRKLGALREGALLEDKLNTDNRIYSDQLYDRRIAQQRADETERANREREENNRKRTDIADYRAQIYALRTQLPDYDFNFNGPNVMVADPRTGQVTDTGIPTGSLSQADRLSLTHRNRMAEIGASGAQARETVRTRGEAGLSDNWEIFTNNGKTYRTNPDTGETYEVKLPSSGGTTAPKVSGANPGAFPVTSIGGVNTGLSGELMRPGTSRTPAPSTTRTDIITDASGNQSTRVSTTGPTGNRIRVRRKSDGRTGTVSEKFFDPNTYERVE